MCYHTSTPNQERLNAFLKGKYTIEEYNARYHANGYNHPALPVTAAHEPTTVKPYSWGLIPFFAKDEIAARDIRTKTLNAKSETIFELPSYKHSATSKRCLIYSDGFFEWQHIGKEKKPYFIYMPHHEPFAYGGLYNEWINKETGEVLNTVSIITTPANELMKEIHNSKQRMPFIIPQEEWAQWLDKTTDTGLIKTMMRPYKDGILQAHSISKLITSRSEDSNVPAVQKPYSNELFG